MQNMSEGGLQKMAIRPLRFRFYYHHCAEDKWSILEELTLEEIADKGEFCWDHERVRVCQYTGLLDHKGTPIYEGDILAWSYLPLRRQVVEFTAKHTRITEGHGQSGTEQCFGYNFGSWTPVEKSTIIGNIYEDSHLLGKE